MKHEIGFLSNPLRYICMYSIWFKISKVFTQNFGNIHSKF